MARGIFLLLAQPAEALHGAEIADADLRRGRAGRRLVLLDECGPAALLDRRALVARQRLDGALGERRIGGQRLEAVAAAIRLGRADDHRPAAVAALAEA